MKIKALIFFILEPFLIVVYESGWADVAAGFWDGKGRLSRQRRKNAE